MEIIPSFTIDHSCLNPGIYVSRRDTITTPWAEDIVITSYDIRMTAPNREPALNPAAMHTIEHLVATFLRNHPDWADKVIYWGPMGCMTGNYLIIKGKYDPETIRTLMLEAFSFVAEYEGIVPGTSPDECGNCLMHDLPMAKWEAKRYLERLRNSFCSEYPGTR